MHVKCLARCRNPALHLLAAHPISVSVYVCVHVVGIGREDMHQSNNQVLGRAVFPQMHMFKS